jgi:hypothetical protein
VLREIPRSTAIQESGRDVRTLTVPVAGMDPVGAEVSFRAGMDVSALPRGAYAVLLLLPNPTGGAWAPDVRGIDQRVIATYVARYPPPAAVCCLVG